MKEVLVAYFKLLCQHLPAVNKVMAKSTPCLIMHHAMKTKTEWRYKTTHS